MDPISRQVSGTKRFQGDGGRAGETRRHHDLPRCGRQGSACVRSRPEDCGHPEGLV